MRKKIYSVISFIILIIMLANVSNAFNTNTITANSREENIMQEFNYQLSETISDGDENLKNELESIAKNTTTLLLGNPNNTDETSEDYYKRYKEYVKLRYAPNIPKDENGELDKNSKEYQDDVVSGYTVVPMFTQFNSYNIVYSTFGDIRVNKLNDLMIVTVVLPDVKMKEESSIDYTKYEIVETNLVIYYYYKLQGTEYKLYYLFGSTTEDLENYSYEIESLENDMSNNITSLYKNELSQIYNFEKLNNLSDEILNSIYNVNKQYIVKISGVGFTGIPVSANGFFIRDNLVVTTWSFLERALTEAQEIVILDSSGRSYEIEGIVTINHDTNVAIIKTAQNSEGYVKLGDCSNLNIEDVSVVLSSKSGLGLTTHKGIVIANGGYIQSTIPLSQVDEGSPLYNEKGEVIGINTAYSVNTNVSIAVNSNVLKEIQEKFEDVNEINSIPFEQIKEKYFYKSQNEEKIVNNVPDKIWNEYKKIGNIEENILLTETKRIYKNKKLSIRYRNDLIDNLDTMMAIQTYISTLDEQGYRNVLTQENKIIYTNDKYKIVLQIELNYLVVGIEKL